MPVTEGTAQPIRWIGTKFFGRTTLSSAELRAIQRYVADLCETADGLPEVIVRINDCNPPRYYVSNEKLVKVFMTEMNALHLYLANQSLQLALGSVQALGLDEGMGAADILIDGKPEIRRIWNRLRVARDGIGRLPPERNPEVMNGLMQSIMNERQVDIDYCNSAGVVKKLRVSIQALVVKDSTLYVITTNMLTDLPRHLAAHRIQRVTVLPHVAQWRPDFDVDKYIENEYQLSHVLNKLDPLIELKLKIHKDYLYHFKERPLIAEQSIEPDEAGSEWHILKATIPHTFMLKSFLQSMGAGIEVLAPADIREEMKLHIKKLANMYACANDGLC